MDIVSYVRDGDDDFKLPRYGMFVMRL
jgi:hypothetical protein